MKTLGIFLNSQRERTRAALWIGFGFNIIVVLFKVFTGIFYRSVWFGAMAVYYFLLCAIKLLLIRTDMKLKKRENRHFILKRSLKSFKRCGELLMLLNLSMAVIVVIIIKYDKKAEYSGFVLWVFGIYTLARAVVSGFDIARLKRLEDPLVSASKHLGISVTLMSIFSLGTVIFDRFCKDDGVRRLLNALVGSGVCITVIFIALSMIVKASRRLR